jgi:hypothetical protein
MDTRAYTGGMFVVSGCVARRMGICIISDEAGHGKLAKDLVGQLQHYLRRYPPPMPNEEEIVLSELSAHVDLVDEEIDLSTPEGEGEIDLSAPYR